MAWTANLDSIRKDGGNIIATVTYKSDEGETQTQDIPGNDLTPATLATFVGNRILALETRDLAFQTLTLGPIVPPPPTPDQQTELNSLAVLISQSRPAAITI